MASGFGRPNTSGFTFGASGYSRVGTPRHPSFAPQPQEREAKPLILPPTIHRDAMVHREAPRIPWDEFLRDWFEWKRFDAEGNPSGQHVALVGPTGQGKTTLIHNLYRLHPYTVMLGTKQKDPSLDSFVKSGFLELERWRSIDPAEAPRRLIRPRAESLRELVPIQRHVLEEAIERVFAEGYWDLIIDEGYYVDEVLKLAALLRLIYTQIRSAGVSIVLATQRPAWVPVEVYDQSTHLFFWRDNDKKNLDRLREVSVRNSKAIQAIIPELEEHQVLYMNTRTGAMCRTRCPKIALPTGR